MNGSKGDDSYEQDEQAVLGEVGTALRTEYFDEELFHGLEHRHRGGKWPWAYGPKRLYLGFAIPRRMASIAAWVRSDTDSFWKMDARWFFTVFCDM